VLNLDNNLISDLSNLTGLSLLAVLRLNHNRIESLGPDKPVRAGAPEPTPTGLMVVPTRILCWNLISPHLVSSLLIPSRPIPSLLIRSHLILISSHRLNRTSPHLTSPHLTSPHHSPWGGLQTLSALEVLQLGFNDIHSLAACRHLPFGALKVLFLQVRLQGKRALPNPQKSPVSPEKRRANTGRCRCGSIALCYA
jgi:Leucine-rich repeat (LRR) protein